MTTPKLIPIRLRPLKNQIILLTYQPNLVSRQFALNHVMPKPIFNKKSVIILYIMHHIEAECNKEMSHYVGPTQITLIPFKLSYYCTQEYDTWWRSYYSTKMFDVLAFNKHLTTAFASIQERSKKGISTHIKEIQVFQKYFETAYIPDDLCRTIHEATITLREKFTKKFPDLKLPSYVKYEQRYELDFNLHPPKFPRLPTTDFGVAFSPLFPNWFICGDFVKILRQDSQKLVQRVVPTKRTLNSFKGHLHIDMEHVHILSPIYEGA